MILLKIVTCGIKMHRNRNNMQITYVFVSQALIGFSRDESYSFALLAGIWYCFVYRIDLILCVKCEYAHLK